MNKTAAEILRILENSKGEPVSGEKIASDLNITRSAVWKHIKAIKEAGFSVRSGNNRGYELVGKSELFTELGVLNEFHSLDCKGEIRPEIEVIEECDSTNAVLKDLARKGGKEGKVLIAKKQTAGRGRLGRSFFSPKSGLYMSFILRPELSFKDSLLLTTIAAVSVIEAIREVSGKNCGIKWVNDVYMGEKKICGILTEAEANLENGMLSFAIVGIGLNLTEPEEGIPEDLKEIMGVLFEKEKVSEEIFNKLAATIIKNYFFYYEKLPERLFMKSYRENQILNGKDIYVITNTEKRGAKVIGVDEEARLLVEYENGEKSTIFTGEVSVRKRGQEKKRAPVFPSVKKGLLFFLLCVSLLFASACHKAEGNGKETASVGMEEGVKEEGFSFRSGNATFDFDTDPKEALSTLGTPLRTFTAPSCAFLGEEEIYTYSGFEITIGKEKKGEQGKLVSVLLTDDGVKTKEGLYIGDTEEKVKKLYGERKPEKGMYLYTKGNTALYILVKNDRVISIEYRLNE